MRNTDPSAKPITNLIVLDLIDALNEFDGAIVEAYSEGVRDHFYYGYDEPTSPVLSDAEKQAYRAGWQRAEKDKNR